MQHPLHMLQVDNNYTTPSSDATHLSYQPIVQPHLSKNAKPTTLYASSSNDDDDDDGKSKD